MPVCEYCDKTLASYNSLYTHQKRAKYCLKIQCEKGSIEKISYLTCKDCNKHFTTKRERQNHVEICLEKYKKENEELKRMNEELKKDNESLKLEKAKTQVYKDLFTNLSDKTTDCLHEIAKQPRTQNTTQTNQLLLLTPFDLENQEVQEFIKNSVEEHFDKDYFLDGPKGVAQFAVDKLLRDTDGKLKYVCTDPSRHIFKFRSDNGDILRDVKALKLTSLLTPSVKNKSALISQENCDLSFDDDPYQQKCEEIHSIENDNGTFRSELSALTANS